MKSGTALKVLAEDEESGHTKVKVIDGGLVADVISILGSLNLIAGELDR